VHNPAQRRSRDFKPVSYGAIIGIPNARHAEPFSLLKNIKDIYQENDNFGIKFTKAFLRGAFAGGFLGYFYFIGAPAGQLEMNKLIASAGPRAYSGQIFRLFRNVAGRYALLGGMASMSYTVLLYSFRHHDEGNPRPFIFDHTAATTLIAMGGTALYASHPYQIFLAGFFSLMVISPLTWYMSNMAKMNSLRSPNIFYENSCTAEDVERFRAQDAIERAAQEMKAQPGYGFFMQNDAKGL